MLVACGDLFECWNTNYIILSLKKAPNWPIFEWPCESWFSWWPRMASVDLYFKKLLQYTRNLHRQRKKKKLDYGDILRKIGLVWKIENLPNKSVYINLPNPNQICCLVCLSIIVATISSKRTHWLALEGIGEFYFRWLENSIIEIGNAVSIQLMLNHLNCYSS